MPSDDGVSISKGVAVENIIVYYRSVNRNRSKSRVCLVHRLLYSV